MTLHRFGQLTAAALLISACAGRAAAQDVSKEGQRPALETQRQTQQARAAEEAAKIKPAETAEVTYEQVLAQPDNLELNYRYANAQVRRGELKGAASTLERMLMIDANQANVRLFYAVVLYRLDDIVDAESQLDILAKLALPEPLASEVAQYKALVSKRLRKTHLSGRAGVGFAYDTNRNAAPGSGARLFGDTPLGLTGTALRRDDTSALFQIGTDLRHRFANDQEAFASASYYHADQTLVKTLNLQAYSLQGGGALHHGRDRLIPTVQFNHILLAQTTFLRERGVNLRYEHAFGKRGDVYVDVADSYQSFSNTAVVPTADDRTGIEASVTIGGDYVLTPKMKAGEGLLHGVKHAHKHINAYQRDGLLLNHIWLLGRGTFLLSNFVMNFDKYHDPDTAISLQTRYDKTFRASATYGLPLALLQPKLKDFLWTFTYEYYHALSTVQNYGYSNNKIATMLTYKWDFGF